MDKIAVVDFGGQYAHLIANRIRRLKMFCEVLSPEILGDVFKQYKGIILSGGPQSVYSEFAPTIDREVFALKIPVLGICYGHQLMAYSLGGTVEPAVTKEYGDTKLEIKKHSKILDGLSRHETVWMSHGDEITALPQGFEASASTPNCKFAAIENPKKKLFSVQFHAEVTHTKSGMRILDNFLKICKVRRTWSIAKFIKEIKNKVRRQVGSKKVFMMVSGGVDSTVGFTLLKKILGSRRLFGLFVDTGFLRLNERENVMNMFKNLGHAVRLRRTQAHMTRRPPEADSNPKNIMCYDASKEFFSALKNVTDPEIKRRIIGDLFIEIQKKVVKKLKLNASHWMLGQGTIYPDTIETGGTRHAAKIKTHHNRVPVIEELIKKNLIIEPLKDLYKDEVRWLGEKLGIPREIIWRHPFPGPGLAVRCICAKKPSYPKNSASLEKKINKLLGLYGFDGKILAIQSVGVQGDSRTYKHPIAILGKGDWRTLAEISTKITNKFGDINRVVYVAKPAYIKSVKLNPTSLNEKTIAILKNADAVVNDFIKKNLMVFDIWQFPVVLTPISVNSSDKFSIVIRPVCSEEAMTASFYQMDFDLLGKLAESLMEIPEISAVFYDITNKPPATIEWE
ncbi:glutamine-hydrolyzing GMP synthase [Candidatus Peregrinibacteria bacterium]|nr:glutamine-hydrolyzing GMP synthase [Candidatus Peregrinibacteria bacterium]